MRSDDNFKLKKKKLLILSNMFYRENGKVPRRFDSNNDSGTIPATPEEYYRESNRAIRD